LRENLTGEAGEEIFLQFARFSPFKRMLFDQLRDDRTWAFRKTLNLFFKSPLIEADLAICSVYKLKKVSHQCIIGLAARSFQICDQRVQLMATGQLHCSGLKQYFQLVCAHLGCLSCGIDVFGSYEYQRKVTRNFFQQSSTVEKVLARLGNLAFDPLLPSCVLRQFGLRCGFMVCDEECQSYSNLRVAMYFGKAVKHLYGTIFSTFTGGIFCQQCSPVLVPFGPHRPIKFVSPPNMSAPFRGARRVLGCAGHRTLAYRTARHAT